jgi:hypothetical protein
MPEEHTGGQPADRPLRVLVDGEECTAISSKDSVMFKKDNGQVWGIMRSAIQMTTFDSSDAIILAYKDGDVVKSLKVTSRPSQLRPGEPEHAPGFICMALMI